MKSRRLLLLLIPVVLLLLAARIANQRLQADAEVRESHLLSIHSAISQHLWEHPGSLTSDLATLLGEATSPSAGPRMLRPFPDGLAFTRRGEHGFTLEEARAHRITIVTKDRLVSTDEKLPYWESSGRAATK